MNFLLKTFTKEQDGAVTIDWVVLTAAVTGLAFAAFTSIQGGSESVGTATQEMIESLEVGTIGD
ncbi:MAG: hypothetical protein P1U53_15655 [Sulfitobacter sp.]|nr:hypothetical protein [Sulfitobacter sp.]